MSRVCGRIGYAFAAILIVGFLGTACGGQRSEGAAVRIGYLPIAAELPLFVAVEQGIFSRQGLEVELVRLPSSNELTNAANAGAVDVLAGAALNVVWDSGAVSGNKHLLFVVNPYSDREGFTTDYLLVRKDSGIDEVQGLRGRKIGSFPGSVAVLVELGLSAYGLPKGSYEALPLEAKDWQPALASGAVDAVVALEPTATQIMIDEVGEPLIAGFYAKLMQDLPLSGHWIAADYAEAVENEGAIKKLVAAYAEAIQFCREQPDAAKQYLAQYANVRADVLGAVDLNPWTVVGNDERNKIDEYAQLLHESGALRRKVDTAEYLLSN